MHHKIRGRIVMAPLQKRAWYALALGVVFTIAIVAVFIIKGGVTAYSEDQGMRLIVAILFVGFLSLYGIVLFATSPKRGWVKVIMDERDAAVVRRALYVQLWAVILSLVVWAIALTEIYWDQGHIPVIFPYLIFGSALIVNTLAQAAGILIGYRRMG